MEILYTLIDFILHIDKHLLDITNEYSTLTYVILFLIIFCETGLIITPLLPGDSLLFAIGAIAAYPDSALSYVPSMAILICAAILGDFTNYYIGKWFGLKLINSKRKIIKKKYIDETEKFFDKYGSIAIVYGRFLPIFRTFVPFVAGIAKMHYKRFVSFNIIGAFIWVISFISLGYFFGNLPIIKENFSHVILGIIIVSLIPPVYHFIKVKYFKKPSTQNKDTVE